MSNIPANLKYTPTHEWLRLEADGSVTVGITDHAQEALGDMVYVELPAVGKHFAAGKEMAVVESVKAASDVYAPVAGTVTAINQEVVDAPESLNREAYANWLFRLQPDNAADLATLLDADAYAKAAEE